MCDTGHILGNINHGFPKKGPGIGDGIFLGEETCETNASYLIAHKDRRYECHWDVRLSSLSWQ